jgi:hypothetical protein
MKKIIICTTFAVIAMCTYSQEQGKFRGSLNVGACLTGITSAGFLLANVQLGYNLRDNVNVGGRFMWWNITDNTIGTATYYFNSEKSSFAPFVGGGVGVFRHYSNHIHRNDSLWNRVSTFGGMLTTGFEFKRFRLGLEYNILSKTMALSSKNFALTAGFYIGGGKWGEQNKIAKRATSRPTRRQQVGMGGAFCPPARNSWDYRPVIFNRP